MRCSIPLLLLALLAPDLAAQDTFEGVISMTMTADDKPMPATVWVKGNKAKYRMSAGGGLGDMIVDATGRMLMLMPQQKQYMVMDMTGAGGEAQKNLVGNTYTKTGKSETIAGMSCDYWKTIDTKDKKVTSESCMTSALGWVGVDLTGKGMVSKEFLAEFRRAFPKGAFPLKVLDPETGKVMLVVTKVEKSSVPDDTFQPPSGFKEMKVPSAASRPAR